MTRVVMFGFAGLVAYDAYLLWQSGLGSLGFGLRVATGVAGLLAGWAWRSERTKALIAEQYAHYERTGKHKYPHYHEL